MSDSIKIFLSVLLGLIFGALIVLGTAHFGEPGQLTSVPIGGEYHSTTTSSTWDALANNWKLLKTGSGTLGSVVVTKTSNAPLCLYDATTTVNGAIYGTTTLACFNTTTVGTYQFDVVFYTGLVADAASTVGVASSSITFR